MKNLMICPKGSGNTYNVCQYVCSRAEAELKVVNDDAAGIDFTGYDIIILASGVYANHVHRNLLELVKSIRKDAFRPGTKVYMFLTWIGRGTSDLTAFREIKRLLNEKGIQMEDNYMKCFGKGMGVIKRSHPDREDYDNVLSWVNGLKTNSLSE